MYCILRERESEEGWWVAVIKPIKNVSDFAAIESAPRGERVRATVSCSESWYPMGNEGVSLEKIESWRGVLGKPAYQVKAIPSRLSNKLMFVICFGKTQVSVTVVFLIWHCYTVRSTGIYCFIKDLAQYQVYFVQWIHCLFLFFSSLRHGSSGLIPSL